MSQKIEVSAPVVLAGNGVTVSQSVRYMNDFGAVTAFVNGTWGGGSLTAEISADNINWADSGATAITANGALKVGGSVAVAFRFIRAKLAGATAPSLSIVFAY